MTGDGPTIGPTTTSPLRAPLGNNATRIATLLHSFPGLRYETIARALWLSPLITVETLGNLMRQGFVNFIPEQWGRAEMHLGHWEPTGRWDPDAEPTEAGLVPLWPEERGPLPIPEGVER